MAVSSQNRKELDAAWSERLSAGDPTVWEEVVREYDPPLRSLLAKSVGRGLTEEDVDDVLQESFKTLFVEFRPARSGSISNFLFRVAGRQRDLSLRRYYRRQLPGTGDHDGDFEIAAGERYDPGWRLAARQNAAEERAVLREVDACVRNGLTARQRQAFEGRINAENPKRWAKEMELRTGIDAKAWRRADDEARQRIRSWLEARGLFNRAKERSHASGQRGTA